MHHRARDITGVRLHSLTAMRYTGSNGKKSLWLIRCDCGKEVILPASEFLKGRSKSCGCQKNALISEKAKTHGMSQHPAYWVWRSMCDRCRLETHQAWKNYGGRGIRVCPEWTESFEAFWTDMGESYISGLSIERIDVNGGYCRENCRWATSKEQARNKRNNILVKTPRGLMTLSEASEISGIGVSTLHYRVKNKCPENLLFVPPDVRNRFMTSETRAS